MGNSIDWRKAKTNPRGYTDGKSKAKWRFRRATTKQKKFLASLMKKTGEIKDLNLRPDLTQIEASEMIESLKNDTWRSKVLFLRHMGYGG